MSRIQLGVKMAILKIVQASATLPSPPPDPIEVFDRLLPSYFETQFLVRSLNSDKNWSVELVIKFGEAGTPYAEKITIHGLTSDTSFRFYGGRLLPFRDLEGIQRWQSEEVFKNQTELVYESVALAIQGLAYKGTIDDWGIPVRIKDDELQLFQREVLNSKESREIRRQVQALTYGGSVSNEELKETARIYREEIKNAESAKRRARPKLAVAEYFGIKDKSAEYRIQRSREERFLEPVKKVSAKRQKVKKGKVNARKKKK
jgi:hypothetical protein